MGASIESVTGDSAEGSRAVAERFTDLAVRSGALRGTERRRRPRPAPH